MGRKHRVAMIGCGKRACEHLRALLADSRSEVVALVDVKPDAAAKMKDDFALASAVYSDHRRMLAEIKPEVAVVCLWTPLHLPVFRDCVAHEVKAVLSEKPMAPTWGECREMARLAETSGTMLTFSHQRRFATGNLLARKLIGEGCLGKVERMDLYSPPNMLDCGTHTLDQAFSFNGETPVKWVLGTVDLSQTLNWFDVKSEALAVATLVYENGVRAVMQAGGPDMDLPGGGVRVTGSEGFLEVTWDGGFKRAVRYGEPGWNPVPEPDQPGGHMNGMIRNAMDCLESGAVPELSYQKALKAAEVIFAFYESVRRRTMVTLPLAGVDGNPLHELLS